MIRVFYRWEVKPENFKTFKDVWRTTTINIHNMVDGAHGSVLMVDAEHRSTVITMAKWDSIDVWKEFWGNSNPQEMYKMNQLAKRVSVEVFEEIEDQTQ